MPGRSVAVDHGDLDKPLERISTLWSVICRASAGPGAEVADAQRQLLLRYGRAVHRYLLGALRDAEAAEELSQEFALRLIRGDYRRADPEKGRFRDFVKGVLFHLIADHHRGRKRTPRPLAPEGGDPPGPDHDPADPDGQFVTTWREAVLGRAWEALAQVERRVGQPWYTVLDLRARQPELSSTRMAEQLSAQLHRPVTADWVRQTLHRARERFTDLLLREVAHTLETPTVADLEQELADLGLLEYCRTALDRYRPA
jgi:RNA polymerase sigma-70 factor (ECF subfamily)